MVGRTKGLFVLALSLSLALSLLVAGCAPPQSQTPPPSSGNISSGDGGVRLPPIPDPDKGNPKLDPWYQELIDAEKRGEAESFARQSNLHLVDGKVRVIVEAESDQVNAAAEAVRAVGTITLIYHNEIQARVLIASLTALADEKSVRLIRRPVSPSY